MTTKGKVAKWNELNILSRYWAWPKLVIDGINASGSRAGANFSVEATDPQSSSLHCFCEVRVFQCTLNKTKIRLMKG